MTTASDHIRRARALIRSWFSPAPPSLFERTMQELNRREAEARKAHKAIRPIRAMKQELVRRNLVGEVR